MLDTSNTETKFKVVIDHDLKLYCLVPKDVDLKDQESIKAAQEEFLEQRKEALSNAGISPDVIDKIKPPVAAFLEADKNRGININIFSFGEVPSVLSDDQKKILDEYNGREVDVKIDNSGKIKFFPLGRTGQIFGIPATVGETVKELRKACKEAGFALKKGEPFKGTHINFAAILPETPLLVEFKTESTETGEEIDRFTRVILRPPLKNIPVFANSWSSQKLNELVQRSSGKVDLETLIRIGLAAVEGNNGTSVDKLKLFKETDQEVMRKALNTADEYGIYPLTVAAAGTGPDLRNSKNYDGRTACMEDIFQKSLKKTTEPEALKQALAWAVLRDKSDHAQAIITQATALNLEDITFERYIKPIVEAYSIPSTILEEEEKTFNENKSRRRLSDLKLAQSLTEYRRSPAMHRKLFKEPEQNPAEPEKQETASEVNEEKLRSESPTQKVQVDPTAQSPEQHEKNSNELGEIKFFEKPEQNPAEPKKQETASEVNEEKPRSESPTQKVQEAEVDPLATKEEMSH